MALNNYQRVEITCAAELRAWLEVHHGHAEPIWLVRYKKHVPGKYVSWDEAVDEAICFGWIDSTPRKLDADRTMLLLAPRRPGSPWSALNKRRVARLRRERRVAPPGEHAIERAKRDGSWSLLDDVEALVVPDDLRAAFDQASPEARSHFDRFPASARKGILWWIKSAKTPKTRAKRVHETCRLAAMNLRANYPESKGI